MADARKVDSIVVQDEFLARVLAPYKPHCRYLKTAIVDHGEGWPLCRISGTFEIPESCYIDDTGHLNAVEVNICYNQMLYTLYAIGIDRGLIPAMRDLTLDKYLQRQLPDVLIHKIDMAFRSPIEPRRFSGRITFEDAIDRRRFILFPSSCAFWDERGGRADGTVSVIFDNRRSGRVADGGSGAETEKGSEQEGR